MVNAAVGSKAVLGRALESTQGLPVVGGAADLYFFNFISAALARASKENPSLAITGFGGSDRGTPGEVTHEKALKYDLTVNRIIDDLTAMFGLPTITNLTGAWLLQFRPGAASPTYRYFTRYFYEGGSYPATLAQGLRCAGLSLVDTANKRVEVTPSWSEPTGDSIYGFTVADSANTGTAVAKQIAVRGRRPYDSNYTAPKSVYLKVVSSTSTTVTFKAAFDTPSPGTGSGFPSTSFGSHTFIATRAVWNTFIDSNDSLGSPIGLFGENNEPFELTIGDQAGTVFAANDLFEIPVAAPALPKTVVAEHRLSTFHLTNAIAGASVLIDSGTTKWERPVKEYYSNSRRFPSNVDDTGDIAGSMQFKKRLFDIAFREVQEASSRVSAVQTWAFGSPLIANVFEGIEIFYPQMRVDTMKSGEVPNKNTLEETITLMAEQPDAAPTQPTSILTPGGNYFDTSAQYPFQINVVTPINPSRIV